MTFTPKLLASAAVVLLTAAAAVCADAGGRTAQHAFADLPAEATPAISRNMRRTMLDYYNGGSSIAVQNVLRDSSRVSFADDRRVVVALSPRSTIEVALVPLRRDTLTAVIETVLTPAADSYVTFYRSDGTVLPPVAMPGAEAFAKDKSAPAAPLFFVSATYDADKGTFIFTDSSADSIMALTDAARYDAYRHQRRFSFDGKRFVPADGIK